MHHDPAMEYTDCMFTSSFLYVHMLVAMYRIGCVQKNNYGDKWPSSSWKPHQFLETTRNNNNRITVNITVIIANGLLLLLCSMSHCGFKKEATCGQTQKPTKLP